MDIENKRDDFHPLEGSAAIQAIYQTLSNHSRIIKRLVQNLNDMRAQVGLCKCPDLDENIEVFEPTKSLGYGYFDKKPMLKGRPSDFNYTANSSQKNNRNRAIAHDRPSLDDLTAGKFIRSTFLISAFIVNSLKLISYMIWHRHD